MAQLKAVSFRVWLGGTLAVFTGEQNGTLAINHNPADTSSKDSDWETSIEGKRNWTLASDGVFEVDDTATKAAETAIIAGSQVSVAMRDAENNDGYTGTAEVISYELAGSDGESVKFSISMKGTGALTPGTY